MSTNKSIWAWAGGAALLIVIIVGLWWWHTGTAKVASQEVGYQATSTDALASSNTPKTAPVKTQVRAGSVMAVINSIPDASRFATMLGTSGVASQLTGKGPYTVFVPINESYAHLPPNALTGLSGAQLKRLVEYHVISGRSIDVNVQQAGTVQAMSKDMLNFNVRVGDKSARVNSSVALQSFKASNGIVYLIDQVLLPPVSTQ